MTSQRSPGCTPRSGPQRVIAASNFVYTAGSGLYLTAGVLYFTQAVHLPASQVGLGLGIAGFVSRAVGIPLWLVAATTAPRWLVAGTMLVNTVIVIALQVRASRAIDSLAAGGGAYRRSAVAVLASCSLISLSAGTPTWAAVTLLVTAVLIHTVGDPLRYSTRYELPDAAVPLPRSLT